MEELFINGRNISVNEILRKPQLKTNTEFEETTLRLVKDWLEGRKEFNIESSGSTGRPKAIRLTRSQMKWSARTTAKYLGIKQGMHALLCLDTKYIAGMMMVIRAIENEMSLFAVEPSLNPLEHINESVPIHLCAMVPLQLSEIVKERGSDDRQLNSIKNLLLGGGVIDSGLLKILSVLRGNVFQTFGMTETATHIGLKRINGTQKSKYFEVLPGIKISTDLRGCLCISGPVTDNKLLLTNDLVNIVDDKHFDWLGRIDNLINSGGIKVSPEQVEPVAKSIAAALGFTKDLIICGLPDPELGEKVCLIYEGTEILEFKTVLMEKLKEMLPSYHTPKIIVALKTLEYTRTGKINRQATVKKYLDSKD